MAVTPPRHHLHCDPTGVTDFPDGEGEMDTDDDDLCRCMAGMAAGDAAFMFMFHERFGTKIAWVVRDLVRGMGRLDILCDNDEIDGLVIDACDVLFIRAAGWHPGGALPWNWARQAIRSSVAAGIGHRQVELDESREIGHTTIDGRRVEGAGVEGEASGPQADAADLTGDTVIGLIVEPTRRGRDDLAEIVANNPMVELLDRAIRSVGCERNQLVCWQYGIQKGLGDPSPAHTVGRMFGLTPGNVRQIHRRHMAKVEALINIDDRFEAIREIGWFAA